MLDTGIHNLRIADLQSGDTAVISQNDVFKREKAFGIR
jgi:hypothetical protein